MYSPTDHTFALCAYGESPFLGECIESLLTQTVRSNILVSTSTPNEHIASTAKKYGVELYINEGKPGIAHDWNCAVTHCSTPLVTIAHQDDVYEPRYAETMLGRVNSADKPLIFFTGYGELRAEGKVTDNKLLNVKKTLLRPLESGRHASSKLVRRRCLSLGSPIPHLLPVGDLCASRP